MRADSRIVKSKKSIPLGLRCPEPECEGQLWVSVRSLRDAKDVTGYCDICEYSGHEHGGFLPDVDAMIQAFLDES